MVLDAANAASLLSYPPFLSLLAIAVGLLVMWLRYGKVAIALIFMGVAWSAIWSIPAASDWLRGTLEHRHDTVAEQNLPTADAIVVLGGATRYHWLQRGRVNPWDLPSSRLAAGARAWRLGRAPVVILTGGRGRPGESEAARMKTAIEQLGVPASALVLEERSRNTEENAVNTARIIRAMGARRILLVTSSLHMPRATLLFDRTGVAVMPVPVPERARRVTWVDRWLPTRSALWRSGRALKEYLALAELHVGNERLANERASTSR